MMILNQSICSKIENSNIPQDCKYFYIALTLLESTRHTAKNAIINNNYSGFLKHNKLKRFKSEEEYIAYSERWFHRKNINNEKQFCNYILAGKYAVLSKKQLYSYLNKILKIKNQYVRKNKFR